MEADFSGWVTKAGLRCADGRTIMPDAFKHQDKLQVPLVWQHGHTDPENVLGHVILENREEGVYGYAYFNGTTKAAHARELVEHKDINQMSIWANDLVERAKRVLHGAIREVSLVLSGANPGALIENITLRHSDTGDDDETLEDQAIIYTGLEFEHSDDDGGDGEKPDDEKTLEEVVNSWSEEQKKLVHSLIKDVGSASVDDALAHANGADPTIQEVYDSMTDIQKQVLHYMVGEALGSGGSTEHSNMGGSDDDTSKGNDVVMHNVFENDKDKKGAREQIVLSHSDIQGIVADATKVGSLKEAVANYAVAHGITDIDLLFPEARNLTDTPEFIQRRMEWVNKLLTGVRKSPFSRIKTMQADITVQEARAKGYIKGNMKKEEFFGLARRTTTPQTIYKKQKLDRDDIIDITDFDVVAWLKGEMRIMLDEELARAILVGDGRAVDDADKILEDHIRPVASDSEVYTTLLNVNIDDSLSSMQEVIEAMALNRKDLRGSGLPTFWTTETYLARMLLLKDTTQRKIYKSVDELTTDLRVSEIVTVEVLDEYPDIVGILFNPTDYVVGADKGGAVSMFDDFDIDYNQYKYLIETRASGALVKYKAAMVVKKVAADHVLVTPNAPTFDPDTSGVTIVNTTGVVYRNADTDAVINAAGSPYTVAEGDVYHVHATASDGYYFGSSDVDDWYFTGVAVEQ